MRDRDGFGNLRLVKRRGIRLVDYKIDIDTKNFDFVDRVLARLDSVPCVFVGSPLFTSTFVFGYYSDHSMDFGTAVVSDLALEVEEF